MADPETTLHPRRAVEKMEAYNPPTEGRQGMLRLDFNENTIGPSPQVLEYVRQIAQGELAATYPEYNDARPELARFFNVDPENFTFTNGTDEAIQMVVSTYVDPGQEVLLMRPSYAMYRFYAEVAEAQVYELDYHPDTLSFPVDQMLETISQNTRAILLANPNNPTGTLISRRSIEKILQRAENCAVFIDEAYFEFSGTTVLPLILKYDNLFVSRTFSKVYGLAGFRVGCLFSSAGNTRFLRKAQSPYSVNTLAIEAARAAIRDQEYVQNYVTEVLAARELMRVELEKLHLPYYESDANFLLVHFGEDLSRVLSGLREEGILIRDRSHEIPGAARITIGTREQMDQLLTALREILS
jgi:histidinol-phosphate aminotransferase